MGRPRKHYIDVGDMRIVAPEMSLGLSYDQKTAKLNPIEQAIRDENLLHRQDYDIEGIRNLYYSVACEALKSLSEAIESNNLYEIAVCRAFFDSEAWAAISDMTADDVERRMRKGDLQHEFLNRTHHRPHIKHPSVKSKKEDNNESKLGKKPNRYWKVERN